MPPVDPIRNVQATPNATNPAGQDPLGARNERRGGGGAGGGQKQPPPEEAEAEAWPAEEGPHLEGDALATRRLGDLAAQLDFGDELPWEQAGAAKLPGPKGVGLKGARPGTGPLGRPVAKGAAPQPSAPPKAVPPPQLGGGRRVEAGYDPTAALTQTLSALQSVGRADEAPEVGDEAPQALLPPGGLAKPMAMLRERAAQGPRPAPQRARQVEDDLPLPEGGADLGFGLFQEEPSSPPGRPTPSEGKAPPAPAPAPRRAPGTGGLPQRQGEATPPTPWPGEEAKPKSLRPSEAPLAPRQAPAPPKLDTTPTQEPPAPAPPRSERRPSVGRPASEAPAMKASEAPAPTASEATAPKAPGAQQATGLEGGAPQAPPSAKVEPRKPSSLDAPPPAPKAPADAASLMVRVVDLRTNAGLGGARLELEPVENERLPTLPGQADAQGWWVVPRIAPGLYRLTARHPGKVPTARDLALVAGELEDVGLVMASP